MKITDYEILSHGSMYPDYFQGCGVCYTSFNNVVTGAGCTEREAFDDALEQIADCHDNVITPILEREGIAASEKVADDECYYYVSIRYNIGE